VTDKEFDSTISRVRKIINRWITPCGLRTWQNVDFQYHRNMAEMADSSNQMLSEKERNVAGRAVVDWDYRRATIHLNMDILSRSTDEDVDYIIRHEICHLLVNEMREWSMYEKDVTSCIQHEERVVTDLAMVLGWVRMAGRRDPRPKKK